MGGIKGKVEVVWPMDRGFNGGFRLNKIQKGRVKTMGFLIFAASTK